ncbi:MAG: copper amine oxidase N-terminal domain-containing protein, partial [Firmicutes bacterium]|nr:copper amine oxidase N-terminal domain-containing protein [Bacillota bacterium]
FEHIFKGVFGNVGELIAILATLALLATLLVPMVGPAAAATGYTPLGTVPTVDDDGAFALAKVQAVFAAGEISKGNIVHFYLPSDFQFLNGPNKDDVMTDADWEWGSGTVTKGVYNWIEIPNNYGSVPNGIQPGDLTIKQVDDNEISIEVTGDVDSGRDCMFTLTLGKIWVDKGFDGEIKLTAEAPYGGFPSGDVTVGVVGGGDVTITVTDDQTSDSDFTVTMRIKESRAGALADDTDESLKFILPDGFVWKKDLQEVKKIWGDQTMLDNLTFNYDEDEVSVGLGAGEDSDEATYFELKLQFQVDDETKAEYGDVVAKVSGDTDTNVSEIVVGEYGDYDATIKADKPDTVAYAGLADEEISDIIIKENMKGSLVDGRTILLTLPANARWMELDGKKITDINEDYVVDEDAGVKLLFAGFTGSDNRTLKLKVDSNDPSGKAELTLEDMKVALEAGKTGDLEVEVSGSAGLSGKVTVAKVERSVNITAESAPEVQIGKSGQVAGDLTITETKAGAISDKFKHLKYDEDKDMLYVDEPAGMTPALILDLPEGVGFAAVPKVEVIEGDLDIDESGVYRQDSGQTKDNQLVIPIEGDSNEPSTIKVTGIKLIVDRTVPEGPINVAVVGSAVVQTAPGATIADISPWPNSRSVAVAAAANIVTPAPGEQKATVVFTINSTTYTVNGVEKTMDAAPYIKNDRTFIPVRYAAEACGVTADNIMYADGKVT